MVRIAFLFTCFGFVLCQSRHKQVIDFVIKEANKALKETYNNYTVLHDSFNYRFSDYLAYSSNYSLSDFASAARADDTPVSVVSVRCGPKTTRFLLNMELRMSVFELAYKAHWKLFLLNYFGNMSVSNNDLRARVTGEILVDLAKNPENGLACLPKWKSLAVSRWGDFKLNFSNDNPLYRPLEKVLSFIITVHVPKVVSQITSTYSSNYPLPVSFTKRICPYFWKLARNQ
ncbi:unnamed protein product [Nezara viridula]|uniref:Neuropeptide n=1 Tax=Nezara viridula TaxID=85310 RepID=A0A9P0HBZ6_NEZVI|nr:unnamed protein product [Nezara viridula]